MLGCYELKGSAYAMPNNIEGDKRSMMHVQLTARESYSYVVGAWNTGGSGIPLRGSLVAEACLLGSEILL